jgi:hypothetical protein
MARLWSAVIEEVMEATVEMTVGGGATSAVDGVERVEKKGRKRSGRGDRGWGRGGGR